VLNSSTLLFLGDDHNHVDGDEEKKRKENGKK
jgi:hypothetical protein